jgi:hypothetical protein
MNKAKMIIIRYCSECYFFIDIDEATQMNLEPPVCIFWNGHSDPDGRFVSKLNFKNGNWKIPDFCPLEDYDGNQEVY